MQERPLGNQRPLCFRGGRADGGQDKPFRTVEEQVAILKSRGISFVDEKQAEAFLLRENYYAVVNGYKDAFLDK